MTQEHEELLLKDLCSRLPYGVICKDDYAKVEGKLVQIGINYDMCLLSDDYGKTEFAYIPNCKPYLFPLSSMTEEQYYELQNCSSDDCLEHMELVKTLRDYTDFTHWPLYSYRVIDWFHKNHFDYRGLIPMGLAKDATELNIYQLCDSTKVKCKLRTPLPNNPKITIGTKIRLKTNPDIILSIVSNDCHEDKFECSNGSVLSLKQIEKYYDII